MPFFAPVAFQDISLLVVKAVSYGSRPRARVGQKSLPCAFFLHFHLLMRPYARLVAVLPGRFAPRFPIFDAQGGCYTWAFPSQRLATRLKISPLTRLFSVSIVCPPAPILVKLQWNIFFVVGNIVTVITSSRQSIAVSSSIVVGHILSI